jgi:hypothetical protein
MSKQMSKETLLVKPMLERAAEDRGVKISSANAMRLAVFRCIADRLGVKDAKVRAQAWKSFNEDTPNWFGSNASAGMAALGLKTGITESMEEFDV